MARISGVDLPRDKRIEVALTYIFGVGPSTARKILQTTGVNPDTRVRDLAEDEASRIASFIQANFMVEGDLRREVSQSIKRLMDIGCYRGLRHRRHLPCRGQRTKTNARTSKGPRASVVGGVKKPAAAK